MKPHFYLSLTLLAALGLSQAGAQAPGVSNTAPATARAGSDLSLTRGLVQKIDPRAKQVTLQHGAIKNLDMPAMTMAFGVKDARVLEPLNIGDQVRFRAELADGRLLLTRIEKVAP